MPGLAVILDNKNREEVPGLLERMKTSMKHYDHYTDDYYVHGGFGCARTQPPGFNHEAFPVLNEEEDLAVYMYGMFYDYDDELQKLKDKGYNFRYGNDAEYFLHLYQEIGDKAVENLNGSYAIIVYNLKSGVLKIFSDRFGSRQLYYYLDKENGKYYFTSEVKAIIKDKTVDRTPNLDAFAHLMTFGHLLGDETFFKNINLVPTGTIITISGGEVTKKQYHTIEWGEEDFKSLDEYAKEFADVFSKATKRRWEKGKKAGQVGFMLSGGLDSRAVLAGLLYSGYSPSDIKCVTMGEEGSHEPQNAMEVANTMGIDLKYVEWKYKDNSQFFRTGLKGAYQGDAMFGSMTTGPHNWCYNKYLDHINIVLNGVGPDPGLCEGIHYVKQSDCHSKEELVTRIMNQDPLINEDFIKTLFTPETKAQIGSWASDVVAGLVNSYKPKFWTNIWDNFYIYQRLKRINLTIKHNMRSHFEEDAPIYDNDVLDLYTSMPPEMRWFKHMFFRSSMMIMSRKVTDIPQESTRVPVSASPEHWEFGNWLYKKQLALYQSLIPDPEYGHLMKEHIKNYQFGWGQGESWLKEDEKWQEFIKELLLDGHLEARGVFNMKEIKDIIDEFFTVQQILANTSKKTRLVGALMNIELFFRFFVDEDFEFIKKWGGFEDYMAV